MNPNFDRVPAPNTVVPGAFDRAVPGGELGVAPQTAEKTRTQEVTTFAPAQGAMSAIPPATPQAQAPPTITPPIGLQSASVGQSPDEFSDEEVVRKARALIERTKADPYLQSKEVGKMRAEYLNKRFGREIKTDKE